MLGDKRINVTRVETAGSIKLNLMTRAVQISQQNNASWMLYLDADEFLLLNNFNNINNNASITS